LLAVLVAASAADAAAKPTQPESSDAIVPLKSARLAILEDFESTAVGSIPKGFTKTGAVAVVAGESHSGDKCLRMEGANNGPRRITMQGPAITALGGQHWGRLFFKVQLPVPMPSGAGNFPVIHSTLVSCTAQSPQFKDPIEARFLDTVMGPKQSFQYIYNVQPQKRQEFANGSKYDYHYTSEWTLAEWFVDYSTQTYRLFINGAEIPDVAMHKGEGNFTKCEIPDVMESMSFGWNNYQAAGAGFVSWIDDIAVGKDRIGAQVTQPAPKAKKPAVAP
jgi:hypothetical protein